MPVTPLLESQVVELLEALLATLGLELGNACLRVESVELLEGELIA